MSKKVISSLILATVLVQSVFFLSPNKVSASLTDSSGLTVGATYYGGHFDDATGKWVISNVNQCTRIAAGEISLASLDATVAPACNDDNGLGYLNDIPLHNTVSFAELSNNAGSPDYAALGGLPAGTKLELKYKGRCVVAEKRDIGQGGGPVGSYHRSVDLWWQTARSIGFYNGFDTITLTRVSQSTPLSPLGSTSPCGASPVATASVTNSENTSQSSAQTPVTSSNSSNSTSATATSDKKTNKSPASKDETKQNTASASAVKSGQNIHANGPGVVLNDYTNHATDIFQPDIGNALLEYFLITGIIVGSIVFLIWSRLTHHKKRSANRRSRALPATR